MADFGADQRLKRFYQALTIEQFAKIRIGMPEDEIRLLFGPPGETSYFSRMSEEVWSYRYQPSWSDNRIFNVHFDAKTHSVRSTSDQIDPLLNPPSYGSSGGKWGAARWRFSARRARAWRCGTRPGATASAASPWCAASLRAGGSALHPAGSMYRVSADVTRARSAAGPHPYTEENHHALVAPISAGVRGGVARRRLRLARTAFVPARGVDVRRRVSPRPAAEHRQGARRGHGMAVSEGSERPAHLHGRFRRRSAAQAVLPGADDRAVRQDPDRDARGRDPAAVRPARGDVVLQSHERGSLVVSLPALVER